MTNPYETPGEPDSCPSRRFITAIEVAVIAAILGVLVALLVPAVDAARNAGRYDRAMSAPFSWIVENEGWALIVVPLSFVIVFLLAFCIVRHFVSPSMRDCLPWFECDDSSSASEIPGADQDV